MVLLLLDAMLTLDKDGGVVSITKVVIVKDPEFPAVSVTVTVLFSYVSSSNVLKVLVLEPCTASALDVNPLKQVVVSVPALVEVKIKLGVVLLEGVVIALDSATTGEVTSTSILEDSAPATLFSALSLIIGLNLIVLPVERLPSWPLVSWITLVPLFFSDSVIVDGRAPPVSVDQVPLCIWIWILPPIILASLLSNSNVISNPVFVLFQ